MKYFGSEKITRMRPRNISMMKFQALLRHRESCTGGSAQFYHAMFVKTIILPNK
jgi:hypothetical protein